MTPTDDGSAPAAAPATAPAATLQTLSRGIRMLELLADAGEPLSIPVIAARLGLHRSIAYRILRTLEDHGLVVRDAAGAAELGPRMATLARSVSRDLQSAALPQLTAIANELSMTAFLAVLDRHDVVTLVAVEPSHAHATVAQRPGAAPQIGVGLRVFTYWIDGELGHLVNPDLDLSSEMQDGEEGCLSFPGLRFDTPRALRVVAKGFNQFGEPVVLEGSELMARCIQHETDHLDGILFIDRMDREQRKLAMRAIREAEWSGEATPTVRLSPHATFGRGM